MARTPRNLRGGQRCRLGGFSILSGACQGACWPANNTPALELCTRIRQNSGKIRHRGQARNNLLSPSIAPRASGEGCLSWDPSPLRFQPRLTDNAGVRFSRDAGTGTRPHALPACSPFPQPSPARARAYAPALHPCVCHCSPGRHPPF